MLHRICPHIRKQKFLSLSNELRCVHETLPEDLFLVQVGPALSKVLLSKLAVSLLYYSAHLIRILPERKDFHLVIRHAN